MESMKQSSDPSADPSASGSSQTQTCFANSDGFCVWAHVFFIIFDCLIVFDAFFVLSQPVDYHYVTSSVAAWPRMRLQIYRQDRWGRIDIEYKFLRKCSQSCFWFDVSTF